MRKVSMVILIVLLSVLVGCAAKTDVSVTRPNAGEDIKKSAVFKAPFDTVWQAAIESFGKDFFMIDNIEKSSKIITLAFSADEPNNYVDCGIVHIAHGKETTSFPYAQGYTTYPSPTGGPMLMPSERRVVLSGKMNVVFSNSTPNETTVTVNTRYVLVATDTGKLYVPVGFGMYVPASPRVETISFNAGDQGQNATGSTFCLSRGTLEERLLNGIRTSLGK